jgi:hypothetical protein
MTNTATAADVLAECRRLGIALGPTDTGVKCTTPKGAMTPALAAAVKANRDELRRVLVSEADREHVTGATTSSNCDYERTRALRGWPADVGALADFVLLLTADDLPPAPFALRQDSTVIDTDKFLRAIQADIRAGPHGPRSGSLQRDLCRLRSITLGLPT